ncbi:MAG: helix-turn-helix domain-containing protein [Clostridiales bacterium]|nr:helix-turn-helix domain-containing protein [Clostridiales bacterium]
MQFANIEAERSRNGLTRTECARKLNVSLPTYNRYISGETPIPSDKLLAMVRMFRCSADYLLGEETPLTPTDHPTGQ